ncbi:hypothetical protein FG386_001569 [Cryptosporidium ryanae]|uniref:uncharacterized protein n=1 Tax=Cryptosporidium ryanae TaxID=515981 RepID=UPI00351A102E|nr:hypothetical protein FG386_001569 [Cryptosporidium ryanae]
MLHEFDGLPKKIEYLLSENEHINECYKDCEVKVLYKSDSEKIISKCDILLTELRVLIIENCEYSSSNLKIPTKFSNCRFIYISDIIVNAISTTDVNSSDIPYLYIQLGGEVDEIVDGENEDYFELIEVNITCKSSHSQNTVYSMFNSISETIAYNEQLKNTENGFLSDEEVFFCDEKHMESN